MVDVKGILYSTTFRGGSTGNGTVFSITTAGKESIIYNFQGGPDGGNPFSSLIDVNGTLYSTTDSGGKLSAVPKAPESYSR